LTIRNSRFILVTEVLKMGIMKRIFGYSSIGAAKVAAKRAWESEDYLESALSAAEAGMWGEAARNLLEGEFDREEEEDSNP
jgi:hypothetical protein